MDCLALIEAFAFSKIVEVKCIVENNKIVLFYNCVSIKNNKLYLVRRKLFEFTRK